jgi:hypothetical protein
MVVEKEPTKRIFLCATHDILFLEGDVQQQQQQQLRNSSNSRAAVRLLE